MVVSVADAKRADMLVKRWTETAELQKWKGAWWNNKTIWNTWTRPMRGQILSAFRSNPRVILDVPPIVAAAMPMRFREKWAAVTGKSYGAVFPTTAVNADDLTDAEMAMEQEILGMEDDEEVPELEVVEVLKVVERTEAAATDGKKPKGKTGTASETPEPKAKPPRKRGAKKVVETAAETGEVEMGEGEMGEGETDGSVEVIAAENKCDRCAKANVDCLKRKDSPWMACMGCHGKKTVCSTATVNPTTNKKQGRPPKGEVSKQVKAETSLTTPAESTIRTRSKSLPQKRKTPETPTRKPAAKRKKTKEVIEETETGPWVELLKLPDWPLVVRADSNVSVEQLVSNMRTMHAVMVKCVAALLMASEATMELMAVDKAKRQAAESDESGSGEESEEGEGEDEGDEEVEVEEE